MSWGKKPLIKWKNVQKKFRNEVTSLLPSPCKQMHTGDFTEVSLDSGKVYEVTRKSARSVLWSVSLPWDQQAPKSSESMPGIKEELEVTQGIRLPLSRNSELLISHTLQDCSLICNEEGGRQRSTREGSCCSCKQSSEREGTPLSAHPARQSGCKASHAAAEHKPCRRTHVMAKAQPCDDGETLLTGPMFTSRHTQHHHVGMAELTGKTGHRVLSLYSWQKFFSWHPVCP